MAKVAGKSRVSMEFNIEWQSGEIEHLDRLWADPVNFWRDNFVEGLYQSLLGAGAGETRSVKIDKESFYAPYQQGKVIRVRPEQFSKDRKPAGGQFYPQGVLRGVDNIFTQSMQPCRFLGEDGDLWVFDLNHPLSQYDLTLQATVCEIHSDKVERGGRCEDWFEKVCSDGPGMQVPQANFCGSFLTSSNLARQDETDDAAFYRQPRLVHHLDSLARQTISGLYGSLIPEGAHVLDLMASWESHLPEDLGLGRLSLLGMNEQELGKNPKGTDTTIQNLNNDKKLPYPDGVFDAIICTASVEYLTDPLAIFTEANRVLRPGGILAVTFSNRWFPPKVIQIWTEIHEFERLRFVLDIFQKAGKFTELNTYSRRGHPRPEDDHHLEILFSDPVYAVWGRKR